MEKQAYEIGSRVEKLCVVCNEERGHIVASVTKLGRITRVTCPQCNTRSSYKSSNYAIKQSPTTAVGVPYDQKRTYRSGQTIIHSIYGIGEITALIEPRKMDVLFSDKVRRLVHARA